MLHIFADVSGAQERLTQMQLNINDFGHIDVCEELVDWQVEDMHRKFPNVDSDQEYVSWYTLIWPRSRTWDQRHRAEQRGRSRAPNARRRHFRIPMSKMPRLKGRGHDVLGTTRPILRESLFNRLVQRMIDLLGERLTWERTGGGNKLGTPSEVAQRLSMLQPSGSSGE